MPEYFISETQEKLLQALNSALSQERITSRDLLSKLCPYMRYNLKTGLKRIGLFKAIYEEESGDKKTITIGNVTILIGEYTTQKNLKGNPVPEWDLPGCSSPIRENEKCYCFFGTHASCPIRIRTVAVAPTN